MKNFRTALLACLFAAACPMARGQSLPAPAKPPFAVRASLTGGGALMLQIQSWDAGKVAAASPEFGRAAFLPSAFCALEFNPPGKPPEK